MGIEKSMTANQLVIFWGLVGAMMGLAALGFAAMSTNAKVPSWLVILFFILAAASGIAAAVYVYFITKLSLGIVIGILVIIIGVVITVSAIYRQQSPTNLIQTDTQPLLRLDNNATTIRADNTSLIVIKNRGYGVAYQFSLIMIFASKGRPSDTVRATIAPSANSILPNETAKFESNFINDFTRIKGRSPVGGEKWLVYLQVDYSDTRSGGKLSPDIEWFDVDLSSSPKRFFDMSKEDSQSFAPYVKIELAAISK